MEGQVESKRQRLNDNARASEKNSGKKSSIKAINELGSDAEKLSKDTDAEAYPESLGALFSGIRGDFEAVLNTGVSMFSGAFSFFSDREQDAGNNATPIPATSGAGRLPSMWSASTSAPILTSTPKKDDPLGECAKGAPHSTAPLLSTVAGIAAVAGRSQKQSSVRVKEGDVVNLGILSSTTTLASFSCEDACPNAASEDLIKPAQMLEQVLIVGNCRMIMTQVLPEEKGREKAARMAKVLWSQTLGDLSAYQLTAYLVQATSKDICGGALETGVGISRRLVFFVHSSAKTLSLVMRGQDAVERIERLLEVVHTKRRKHSPDTGNGKVELRQLPTLMVAVADVIAHAPTNSEIADVSNTSGDESSKLAATALPQCSPLRVPLSTSDLPVPAFVALTPGRYCQVDVCSRQLRHGVGEVAVRAKLVNDGVSVSNAEVIISSARLVLAGAKLSLVPGKRKVRMLNLGAAGGETDLKEEERESKICTSPESVKNTLIAAGECTHISVGETSPSPGLGKMRGTKRSVSQVSAVVPDLLKTEFQSPANEREENMEGEIGRQSPALEAAGGEFADVRRQLLGQLNTRPRPPSSFVTSTNLRHVAVTALADPIAFKKPVLPDVESCTVSASLEAPINTGSSSCTYASHPVFGKYFKMLKVGLPLDSVRNKMRKDGVDISVIDRDPAELVQEQAQGDAGSKRKAMGLEEGRELPLLLTATVASHSEKKPSAQRKKKFHWSALDATAVQEGSLWYTEGGGAATEADMTISTGVNIDEDEFNSLFVQSLSPKREELGDMRAKTQQGKQELKTGTVYLIDMKRGQNAAIALARISSKISFAALRSNLERLDGSQLDSDQLQSLLDYLPTPDEANTLRAYTGDEHFLGEAEKFMLEMTRFRIRLAIEDSSSGVGVGPLAAAKCLACLQFQHSFPAKVAELTARIALVQRACESVVSSPRLKKVLLTVLQVGNQMNGNNGNVKVGFTLESLLKLSGAKAFDNKTSLLQYIVMLLYRHDADSSRFTEDLAAGGVAEAARQSLALLAAETVTLHKALTKVGDDIAMFQPQTSGESEESAPLQCFVAEAADLMERVNVTLAALQQRYRSVLVYFGEPDAMTGGGLTDIGPGALHVFATLHRFVLDFTQARDVFLRQRKAEQSRVVREREKEKMPNNSLAPNINASSKMAAGEQVNAAADKENTQNQRLGHETTDA